MAITLITAPTSPVLAYSPVMFQLNSNNADIVHLIIETVVSYDGSVTSIRKSATSIQPNLTTTNEFTFDVSDILSANLSFILKTLGASAVINDTDNLQFKIKAYEVTENPTTKLLETNYDPADASNTNFNYQSSTFAAFNWSESHFSLNSFNLSDYSMVSDDKLFLTEGTNPKTIELNQNEFLGMAYAVSSGGVKNYKIEVLTYNSVNALLNTDLIDVTQWNQVNVNSLTDPYLDAPVGTQNLINAGISLTNVAYYTIRLINDDGDRSELRRYNIIEGCPTDLRVHFVNKFGKQDSITLKGNQIEGYTNKSTRYQKALSSTYSSSDYGSAVVRNTKVKNFTAYSKTIGRDTLAFAQSMLTNNMAWIEVDSSYFSIIIDDGSGVKVNEHNMPIQFILNFSLANNERGLRG
tara:strand:- start:1048 stop:2274 length:1227 start_codon:yes stop_codon:yes gene_type:complete